jgi:hypothetical protein
MILGDWIFRLSPKTDELLSSCLVRNALAHGSTPYRFLNLFWPGFPVWNRDIDRAPNPEWLTQLADILKIQSERLDRCTLRSMRQRLVCGRALEHSGTPLLLSLGVFHRLRRRHGQQYCPACLAFEGFFQRTWRLGFVVSCETHRSALRDACPHCGAPIIPHRVRMQIDLCHVCDGTLIVPCDWDAYPPSAVVDLQRRLRRCLERDRNDVDEGLWNNSNMFLVVRSLLSIAAAPSVNRRLRLAFGLRPLAFVSGERTGFENARLLARVADLDTIAAWTAHWPESFRMGAIEAGLTQRSFIRLLTPEPLATEVAVLPDGSRRDRRLAPLPADTFFSQLRRRAPSAYKTLRGARLLKTAMNRSDHQLLPQPSTNQARLPQ